MLYALQDEHGYYVHRRSTLSGRYTYVSYTTDIKYARLWDDMGANTKAARTRINKTHDKQELLKATNSFTSTRYGDGFSGYDEDNHWYREITKVEIVELELIKKEVKDNG